MAGDDHTIWSYGDILEALTNWSLGMKLIDRTGQKFGKLTVLEQSGRNTSKKVLWKCRCECGKETITDSGSLVTGNTTSCGCYLKERITKHGGWDKASYNTWRAMMRRCYNPKDKDYKRYGAIGVTVCERWRDYLNFAADMGEPEGDETLDRANVYGIYEPSNCRWAGVQTQNRNTRIRANNQVGVTGVSKIGNKYMAKITVCKKSYYSKCFNTVEEAAAARKELERLHWNMP